MIRDSRAARRTGAQTQQWDKRGGVAPVLSARRASAARVSSSDVEFDLCVITVGLHIVSCYCGRLRRLRNYSSEVVLRVRTERRAVSSGRNY